MELRGLERRYGRERVLSGVSLVVTRGRVVVLRGGNGAGKTTLLRVLSTRLRPSRGGGRVLGFDLVREADEVRRRVAWVPVLGGAYPLLTARENLRLAATLLDRRRADLGALLERVGLAEAADRPAGAFSSGMRKRLALARLLLADAPLWLLDEPYAALDEEGRTLVDALLASARAEGRTVLLASHEPERTAPLADAVLTVAGGVVAPWRPPRPAGGGAGAPPGTASGSTPAAGAGAGVAGDAEAAEPGPGGARGGGRGARA